MEERQDRGKKGRGEDGEEEVALPTRGRRGRSRGGGGGGGGGRLHQEFGGDVVTTSSPVGTDAHRACTTPGRKGWVERWTDGGMEGEDREEQRSETCDGTE